MGIPQRRKVFQSHPLISPKFLLHFQNSSDIVHTMLSAYPRKPAGIPFQPNFDHLRTGHFRTWTGHFRTFQDINRTFPDIYGTLASKSARLQMEKPPRRYQKPGLLHAGIPSKAIPPGGRTGHFRTSPAFFAEKTGSIDGGELRVPSFEFRVVDGLSTRNSQHETRNDSRIRVSGRAGPMWLTIKLWEVTSSEFRVTSTDCISTRNSKPVTRNYFSKMEAKCRLMG
jgi:hypothetical protein